MRGAGLVLALALAITTVLALPVGTHHGITPIHTTRADTTVMLIGMLLLYGAGIMLGVEAAHALLQRPRRATLPRARVVR